ncbi:MAG: filamentous hemagglutinin N-terminal domain-containing protein [Pseudomonadota bacterium]
MKHNKHNKKACAVPVARGSIRPCLRLLPLLIVAGLSTASAWANPGGAQTVNGQVSYSSAGNVLTITNSPGAVINWQSFSINAGEVTRFVQQNSSSSVLNRVVGQDPTKILGALQSNGKVFLINPNGIVFGAGAQVNVNGLVASSLQLSNEDFMAGKLKFTDGTAAGSVINQGAITTPSGGQVYLIAPQVENSGVITSPRGDVILAAGRSVQLFDSSSPDLHVVVSAPSDQALNVGQVIAQGGNIGIYGALIKQRGTVNANSAVVGENGKIVFKASGDTLLEAGSVTSATGVGTGGEIQVLGERVGLTGNAVVDASGQTGGGTILVGGDYHGDNAAIQNAKRTYVGADTQLKADALDRGDGGKVIVWSDDTTRAYGSISARGGAQGGNGGFVETSGRQNLDFHAKVNVSAPSGRNGTLLLDPGTITIVGGSGDGDSDGTSTFQGAIAPGTVNFADAGPTMIYQSEIEGMTGGMNLVLEASDYIGTSGTFTGATVTLANNSNLTLRTRNASTDAGSNIGINLIGSDDGTNLTFKTQGSGTMVMQTGTGALPRSAGIQVGKLETGGGQVTLNGTGHVVVGDIRTTPQTGAGGDVAITSSMGSITVNRNIDASGASDSAGNVTLNATQAISVNNSAMENYPIYANQLTMTAMGGISSNGSGPIATRVSSLTATNSGSGNISISNTGSLSIVGTGVVQSGGNIALEASGDINVNAAVNAGIGDVTLNARETSAIVSGGGTITGSSLAATATNGIGHGTALVTRVGTLSANNAGANTDINIVNTGALTLNDVQQTADGSTGNINISNTGALTTASSTSVSTGAGSITLTAHSPLTVNGTVQSANGGNINLTAGATGSSTDILTVAANGVVNTSGAVALRAGNTIVTTGAVTGGTVTRVANLNALVAPTLSECRDRPMMAGCASVVNAMITMQSAVAQALNSTVNIINTNTVQTSPHSMPVITASSATPTEPSDAQAKADNAEKDEKKDDSIAKPEGEKRDVPKKMYCN